jgi:2-polyprenyl-3-methyl-5-hydroxy-6-metoxy-1,4-benzoquinol methylase
MDARTSTAAEDLKSRLKATWMAGDFERIARVTEAAAEAFIARRQLGPGTRVLDVACGTGNLAIPAARSGAVVVGVDIAPNLLDQARARARQNRLDVTFEEGDAEALPFDEGAFDVVLSMFGAMFAPNPGLVAKELARVCRPEGKIAMANWTPNGFLGEVFRTTGKHVSPPTGMPSPLLWGDETAVRQRLAPYTSDLRLTRSMAILCFDASVAETVALYRTYYGPTVRAFATLTETGQAALQRDLEDLCGRYNLAQNGTTHIAAEFLEIVATRS